jgi:hypothetical protein
MTHLTCLTARAIARPTTRKGETGRTHEGQICASPVRVVISLHKGLVCFDEDVSHRRLLLVAGGRKSDKRTEVQENYDERLWLMR